MLLRRSLVVSGCLLAVAWNGCDSDEETDTEATRPMTEAERETVPTDEVPAPTEETPPVTEPETETLPPEEKAPQAPPEEQPGGAGDEEPARSLALFTGRGGRITPRVIRVPAFISIRVELRSVDDREYGLEFDGERIRVSGGLASVSTTIEGLRPGRAVIGNPVGAGNRVRIEATAEPGP
jgi:hypothetical protein